MPRAVVLNRVRGIEAKAVDVVLVNPVEGVLMKNARTSPLCGPSRLTPCPHGLV